jgi:hypothetical protein
MSSSDFADRLDLDRGLPVTPEDVAAQRRRRELPRPGFSAYPAALAALPPASPAELRARRGPHGEPFTLDD